MKRQLLVLLGFLLGTSIFAQCVEPPIPPVTRDSIPERIRNTPAVDPNVTGTGTRFYVTTFGLERFDGSQTHRTRAPLPKPGCLVRFGITNRTPPFDWVWTPGTVIIDNMDTFPFNQQGIPINCYSTTDSQGMENAYPDVLTFTDGSQHTEGWMRYQSGTGFWASPVFYQDILGRKHVILLNKSGCLMSVNVTNPTPEVDWKTDLRVSERILDPFSYKFEFIATPVLLDGKIYVAGIKQIHILDLSSGIMIQPSYTCPDMNPSDYFETPLIYDTGVETDRSFYLVSRLGKAYRFCEPLVTDLTPIAPLGVSQSPPLLDTDGHVYFVNHGPNGPLLNFIEQEQRILNSPTSPMASIALPTFLSPGNVKTSILTDFTQNKYMFRDNDVYRIKEMYDFDPYSVMSDPVTYPATHVNEWCTSTPLNTSGIRFPGNHSVLSYHNTTNKTMLFTINNANSNMYGDGVADYYPSNPAEFDITSTSINLSYLCYNNAYTNPTVQVSVPDVRSNRQTWGGIASYQSSVPAFTGYLNALFGDECGGITTYNSWLSSISVGYDPMFEIGEEVIPDMGYTKYMKNLDNVPTNDEVDQFRVFLYGLEDVDDSYTFANGYARERIQDVVPGSQINAISTTFNKMLPNKRYRITWQDNNDEVVFCDNIEISENSDFVIINADPDLVVEDTALDPDTETSWGYPRPLHFNSVTLEDNAHWRVNNDSNITVTRLILGSGSQVTIGDGAMLNVGETICNSLNGIAKFNVDGQHTGKLNVTSNLENREYSSLQFKGFNVQSPSYVLNTVVNKTNATLELLSMNNFVTSDYVSTSIGSLQNRGRVDVNDCTEVTRNYIDAWQDSNGQTIRGILNINNGSDFGNLVWRIADGSIQSTFCVGETGLEQPERAKLTIKEAICTFKGVDNTPLLYNVYGNIVVKGNSKCVVNNSATLLFKTGSNLDLVGHLDIIYNGAEVIVNMTEFGSPGIIKFEDGVSISGMKPNPDPTDSNRFGDRIITDPNGKIEGPNSRQLSNLRISSTHPNNLRWEGLLVNTEYEIDEHFLLQDSYVSGIDKFYVKYSNSPEYYLNSYNNCSYGIYFDRSNNTTIEQTATISYCSFASNHCGIFIQDNQLSNGIQYLKADIKDECTFGGDTIEDQNEYGISLINCKEAIVQGCDFNNNIFGIYAQDSSILVGGVFDGNGVPTDILLELPNIEPNNFYYNDHAAIWIDHTSSKSLIYHNFFTEQDEPNGRYSGMGIYANDAELNVMNNNFTNLRGHGFLGTKSYRTPDTEPDYHGFSNNLFQDNGGCELIGDGASLSSLKMLVNYPDNRIIDQQGSVANDSSSVFDFENWDNYLVANLTPEEIAEVYNNTFIPNWVAAPDRFYPDVSAFRFVPEPPEPPTSPHSLMNIGTEYFFQGEFGLAQDIMKQIIEAFPDSTITSLAIDFLYLIERATESDYASLREYLDLKIPLENMAPYLEKEAVKTQCYIKEEDYLSAIQRLQLVINNPISVADSLYALIDQSYCLYKYATEGAKALPSCSATTTNIRSYMDFLTKLGNQQILVFQEVSPPNHLLIQGNYPNPFNPSTTINYTVPKDGYVKLIVYNLRGQKVKELVNREHLAGSHRIIWTGIDTSGRSVSSGVYFVRVEQGGKSHVGKMMLLK